MQTFLPYKSFETSARVLDRQRLGKQRVENLQIMRALLVPGAGWATHPAVLMWKGYANWLLDYQKAICDEWTNRGYNDTCLTKTIALYLEHGTLDDCSEEPPKWLGLKKLHSSHRSNLLRKDYIFYLRYKWPEDQFQDYWWPTKEMKNRG